MMSCTRPACPDWLDKHWEEWGKEFEQKLQENMAHRFAWKQYDGQKVNYRLLPLLREMTRSHCAYCDWFPTDVGTDETIDHFRPKATFPNEAYLWSNLYLCCRTCQGKNDTEFTDDLLRPDKGEYSFERYFVYNYRDGTLGVNPQANQPDQKRAGLTIQHLKLNLGGRPAARKRAIDQFRDLTPESRDQHLPNMPFRFILSYELAYEIDSHSCNDEP